MLDYKREDKRKGFRDIYGAKFNLLPIYPYEMVGNFTSADNMARISFQTGHPLFKKNDEGFNTLIEVHGSPRNFSCFGRGIVSKHDKKTMKKIIRLTKRDTPSNDLLILAMCYADDDMAKYIAKKTNRIVVYGNGDKVTQHTRKDGDVVIKSVTGKKLKMAYPDGRRSHEISKKFIIPLSEEMSLRMLGETVEQHNQRVFQIENMFSLSGVKTMGQEATKRDSAKQAVIAGGAMSTVQATRKEEQQNPIEKKNSGPSKTSKVTKSFKM